jgi:hypothetical protein
MSICALLVAALLLSLTMLPAFADEPEVPDVPEVSDIPEVSENTDDFEEITPASPPEVHDYQEGETREILNVVVPITMQFTLDPLEISGFGQVYSDLYTITNQGNTPVMLTFSDMKVTFANDRDFVTVPEPFDHTFASDKKALFLSLDFGREDIAPVALTDPEFANLLTIPLLSGESSGAVASLSFSGNINYLPDLNWESGDVRISLTYTLVEGQMPVSGSATLDPDEEAAESGAPAEAASPVDPAEPSEAPGENVNASEPAASEEPAEIPAKEEPAATPEPEASAEPEAAATPEPTPTPEPITESTPEPTPTPTPEPEPEPAPVPEPEPTPIPEPEPTPEPIPVPEPESPPAEASTPPVEIPPTPEAPPVVEPPAPPEPPAPEPPAPPANTDWVEPAPQQD